ncbi:uncharacterized protein LOC112459733 isoform X2 [Temnothorax curvispinosus]|nr:uncharacterized protein LOC112459733 isoform X2 [Temnothorax curvispinosus]XP_024879773.1 uncharacterized protein LOC112459733 isoform X2 [Temnothorax curvispinosus]XP_024879774.1 uncharacterized protein LOC112459733 isoform X2 [Temnothorax curvispinosus]XP_024879775.1 uncharacterized protein LOC112459733 isoform X2 [Temnothorax curvispinosus]
MSNPEEVNSCVLDTQETYYEGANESFKVINETQSMSLNESQDFHLVDSGADESMVEGIKQTQEGEATCQESVEQMDSQQIPETSRSEVDNNAITTSDKEDKTVTNEKVIENEPIEKTEGKASGELCESEKKDELLDEDEIIQGTPPQSYSPSRKAGSVNVASLKRKAKTVDELPAKIARITSAEDATNVKKQLEEEESHQFYESDDSYQDLFKNIEKNVIIEETQDPTDLEFTQNPLKIPTEHETETTDNEKAQEHTEHTNQQRDETSEKCDVKKDENLNVSANVTDTSANDSTVVIMNSTNENDSQLDDNNLSVETKGDVASTSVVIADEKSGIGTLDETESVKNTETVLDENNQVEQSTCTEPTEKIVDDTDEIPSSQTKSRISIELIYEGTNRAVDEGESRSKPQVVQIDDDGENIVLDSSAEVTYDGQSTKKKPEVVQIDDSHEDGERIVLDSIGNNFQVQTMEKSSFESKSGADFGYNSAESMKESSLDSKLTADKKLVNGNAEAKRSGDTDVTLSLDSDTFSVCDEQILPASVKTVPDMKKIHSAKGSSFASKDVDNIELVSLSDHETSHEEKNKSDLMYNSTAKTVQVEREIGVYVKLKCLMHVDESTKEPVSKELTAVQCEPVIIESMMRRDSQSSPLADISDNKDSSPGSVNSNPQLYQLHLSRLSIMSSISSSSSASSAASLATKIALKGAHFFTMPVGPAKHAKKSTQDQLTTDKQTLDETYDRLTREWKNHRLLTTAVLNYANAELGNITTLGNTTAATATAIADTFANVSNERLDDHHHLEKNNMRSSTPSGEPMAISKMELTVTPKSTKKNKTVKRPRSKMTRQINGKNGTDNIPNEPTLHASTTETETSPSRKKSKIESTLLEDKLLIKNEDVLANSSPQSVVADELIGKTVFAKWSDKNYYPGTVSDRLKTKYKVNFYDGQTKTLIPEFVIPIPKILREGLSVYATTNTNSYDSCGIIVNVQTSDNETYYTVETDEGERLRVQMHNISLSADQAQVLKEEVESAGNCSLPSTPKALGQITLDNVVEGKRRSKRIGTPLFSTPKSRSNAAGTSTSASKIKAEPSVSGISAKLKKEKTLSENESMSSDSNVASAQTEDEYVLRGVQREITNTPYEQMKGLQSKIKGKARSKKKVDEMNATLGPIPTNPNIFKGISFVFTCIDSRELHRFQEMSAASGTKTEATDLETEDGTENETETECETDWGNQPFVRTRLRNQIVAGGGKVYENFGQIPKDEYEKTVLITNVPNYTETSILCLSVDIPVCSHKWITRCCAEEKLVSRAEYALPNGWSCQKKKYVERYDIKYKNKPLSNVVVIIPSLAHDGQFATFWRQVCENAGAFTVLIAENSGAMEAMDFKDAVVVSNRKCPSWAINRAARLKIPVQSTMWVIQSIIEGKRCPYNLHPCYKYNYISN